MFVSEYTNDDNFMYDIVDIISGVGVAVATAPTSPSKRKDACMSIPSDCVSRCKSGLYRMNLRPLRVVGDTDGGYIMWEEN